MNPIRWAFVNEGGALHVFLDGDDVIPAAQSFPRTEAELAIYLRALAFRIEPAVGP